MLNMLAAECRWLRTMDLLASDKRTLAATLRTAEQSLARALAARLDDATVNFMLDYLRSSIVADADAEIRREVLERFVPTQRPLGVTLAGDDTVTIDVLLQSEPTNSATSAVGKSGSFIS
jgi:hypothetical protein